MMQTDDYSFHFWLQCWKNRIIVSLHQGCNVANTGMAMQTQLNLSSNLIGCYWVLSLWTISHKQRILFCDLQCSENYLARFYLFQKNRSKRNYKRNVIAFLLLSAAGVYSVTALKLTLLQKPIFFKKLLALKSAAQ